MLVLVGFCELQSEKFSGKLAFLRHLSLDNFRSDDSDGILVGFSNLGGNKGLLHLSSSLSLLFESSFLVFVRDLAGLSSPFERQIFLSELIGLYLLNVLRPAEVELVGLLVLGLDIVLVGFSFES